MHRMRSVILLFMPATGLVLGLLPAAAFVPCARGDLIRPQAYRAYPDISGDIVGSQTYTFDQRSQTGTFQVVNAPHVITLGPDGQTMINVSPNPDGTLTQTLQLKLDKEGRLLDTPANRFQLFGTVTIGNQVYEGLLLEGKPLNFGAQAEGSRTARKGDAFDLNMKITGGELAKEFGDVAYFRIIPQSNNTFEGSFKTDFSSDRPLTNLRAYQGNLEAPVPEPGSLVVLLTCIVGALALTRRRGRPRPRPRIDEP